jgi:hypothetical protein
MPLVVPSLLRASAKLGRLRFGGCLAADDRLRRCPAEASKDDWEASVTYRTGEAARNVESAATRGLRRQVRKTGVAAEMGGDGVGRRFSLSKAWHCSSKVHLGKQCTEDSWRNNCFSICAARGSHLSGREVYGLRCNVKGRGPHWHLSMSSTKGSDELLGRMQGR